MKTETVEDDRCPSFGKNEATPDHPCPFREEIHNDSKPCRCCDRCAHECAMDI